MKIGDEIRIGEEYRNAFNVVICMIGKRLDGVEVYQCISASGMHYTCTSEDNVRKTGRHFDELEQLFEKMKEVE